MSNSRDGNFGGLIRAKIRATSSQTAAELAEPEPEPACAQMRPLAASAPALIPILRKVRRVVIVLLVPSVQRSLPEALDRVFECRNTRARAPGSTFASLKHESQTHLELTREVGLRGNHPKT